MASAIEKLRYNYRARNASHAREIAKREHTLFQIGASMLLGMADAKGKKLPEIAGVDGRVAVGTGLLIGASSASPTMQKYMQSLADALLGSAAFDFGKRYGASSPAAGGVSDGDAMDALLSSVAEKAGKL